MIAVMIPESARDEGGSVVQETRGQTNMYGFFRLSRELQILAAMTQAPCPSWQEM
jgi:hypothetical protein